MLELRRFPGAWKGLLSGEVAKAGRGSARSIRDSGKSGSGGGGQYCSGFLKEGMVTSYVEFREVGEAPG